MKRSIFVAAALGISLESVYAYSSPTMQSLDNDDLSMVVGQAASAAMTADPYHLGLDQIRFNIQRLTRLDSGPAGSASSFHQIFKVNEDGEVWMSVQRGAISIGTIECSLSFDGLRQFGDALMSEIKFY